MEVDAAQRVNIALVCFDNIFQMYHIVAFLRLRFRLNVAQTRLFVNVFPNVCDVFTLLINKKDSVVTEGNLGYNRCRPYQNIPLCEKRYC